MNSLVHILAGHATQRGDKTLYTWLDEGEREGRTQTFAGLDRKASSIAAALGVAPGTRALLLYPPGLEFIEGFFGCLYAGVVAVPAYPPDPLRLQRTLPRLQAIVRDSRPELVLTTAPILQLAQTMFGQAPELATLRWIATDEAGSAPWTPPRLDERSLAFVQYTSGSTGTPKGVVLTHGNLLHNERLIAEGFGHDDGASVLGWLPLYHDMGLIGNVLQPLYLGASCVLMSPISFLQKPLRWLRAVSSYRATTSGGPNFAYDLCARKATDEDVASLDLSAWRVAYNGAEPVRADTLDRFAARFAAAGFSRSAFYPCYGLAEGSLIVSGATRGRGAVVRSFDPQQSSVLVGAGRVVGDQEVLIVDPGTRQPKAERDTGEIWVRGDSVAQGYWEQPSLTDETFRAHLADGRGPFLRTGDLGFLDAGELFVTGRRKDLIIVRGRNLYPQDLERTVEATDPALRPGCGAAFSIDAGGEERVVVVQEIDKKGATAGERELAALLARIADELVRDHEVVAHEVVLVTAGSIPKTSSGKIQRAATKAEYLGGQLERVASGAPVVADVVADDLAAVPGSARVEVLRAITARTLGVDPTSIDPRQSLSRYGVDSLIAVELQHAIATELGRAVELGALLAGPTILALATELGSSASSEEAIPHSEPRLRGTASFGQASLRFLNDLAPDSAAYHVVSVVRVRGGLDENALERALLELAERHPALRTTLLSSSSGVEQVVSAPRPLLERMASRDEASARAAIAETIARPFDLAAGPLLRILVTTLPDASACLALVVHHAITDFWSLGVLVEDLGALYDAQRRGTSATLPELRVDYLDYARWQRSPRQTEAQERAWRYWRQELAGELPVLALPFDRPRPRAPRHIGAACTVRLSASISRDVSELAAREATSVFSVLLAAYEALLHRYTGQREIVVGVPTAGRPRPELSGVLGYFVNTMPVRLVAPQNEGLRAAARRVSTRLHEAMAHQELPFSELVSRLGIARDPARAPVFQTQLVFQQAAPGHDASLAGFAVGVAGVRTSIGGLEVESMEVEQRSSQLDLAVTLAFIGDELVASFQYDTELFDTATIERLAAHYARLTAEMLAQPDADPRALPLLSSHEETQLLGVFNDTQRDYARDALVHALFEEQSRLRPDAIAVVIGNERLTYRELDERANQLARHLVHCGLAPEQLVGVCVERSLDMIVAVLGVLKAGGAYLPLEASLPPDRLAFMLADADARQIVVQARHAHAFSFDGPCTLIDGDDWRAASFSPLPQSRRSAESLAYVDYTSGSTGRPKGVWITHRGVARLVRNGFARLDSHETWLQLAPLQFDASTLEVWGALCNGGRLVLYPAELPSLEGVAALVLREQVSTLHLTAGLFHPMVDAYPDVLLRVGQLLAGGDVLSAVHVATFSRKLPSGHVFVHCYGPTENTTFTTCDRVEGPLPPGATLSIGRPIANTTVYIVDDALRPVPLGVAGELLTGGDGLARGYVNRPDITAERFVPDPFSASGERLYRTGDQARWLPDGRLEFLGRLDQQVKIRGFRVELGEVESAIALHPGVRDVVVVARDDGSAGKRLVAYVVGEVAAEPLLEALRGSLPEYMVPGAMVMLEQVPLTTNGKVDRRALPEPDFGNRRAEYVEPQPGLEATLAEAWRELLVLPRVGAHDDFFAVGGHSLLAMRLVSRLREQLGIEVPVRAVFEDKTPARLAVRLATMTRAKDAPITRVERGRPLVLSYAQERLWFLDQLERGTATYNMPGALTLTGPLDVPALDAAITALVARHEILRTRFVRDGGQPRQLVEARVEVPLIVEKTTQQLLGTRLRAEAEAPFDLERGPLVRARLFSLAEDHHVLLIAMHHIVSDGWSMAIVQRELSVLYAARRDGHEPQLAELPIQYADYAAWQRATLSGAALTDHVRWWRDALLGAPPLLELPTDRPRPPAQSHRGAVLRFRLDDKASARIDALCRAEGLTPFMVFEAAYVLLLSRHSGQLDVVIGASIAGRTHRELEDLVGFFVNTLALRTQLRRDESVRALLSRIRSAALLAYEHEALPFEKLVEVLAVDRSLAYSPVVQAVLAFQNVPTGALVLPGLSVESISADTSVAKFDLTLEIAQEESHYAGVLTYATDLFDAETAGRMVQHLARLIDGIVTQPEAVALELPMLSAEESAQLARWAGTGAAPVDGALLHELFSQQVARTPDARAVTYAGCSLTYRELDERANRLAHTLRRRGVRPDQLVGLCVERSLDLLVGLLGILKAGGAYLPLDPAYPPDRLAYLIEDSGTRLVVASAACVGRVPIAEVVRLDEVRDDEPSTPPITSTTVEHRAYVIYTSGSTGQPKGAEISHANVARLFASTRTVFDFGPSDVWTLFHSYAFDFSVWEVWGALLHGGRVVVVPHDVSRDPDAFHALVVRERVTVLNQTPSAFYAFIRADEAAGAQLGLRYVIFGGETLDLRALRPWYDRHREPPVLVNMYGITETTVHVTHRRLTAKDAGEAVGSLIGVGLADLSLHVLDPAGFAVPVGVAGELYVGGAGVARGYLGRPALTAERFVPETGGRRLYRSGDLVRWLRDGSLEYLGRLDLQVKIRGFRIELGEIEVALSDQPGVREALVLARTDVPGQTRLVAYVVGSVDGGALRAALAERLPDYMVPAAVVLLDAMPLTANGKVDRKALPAPDSAASAEHVPPRSKTEIAIAAAFAEVLERQPISVLDSFFELGGHSLLATQAMSRIRGALAVDLPLRALFEHPTVERLARHVDETAVHATRATIEPSEGPPVLSHAQERMWFLDQLDPGSRAYLVPAAVRLRGDLDVDALRRALDEVVLRHATLRSRFVTREGAPRVIVDATISARLQLEETTEARLTARLEEEASRPFALDTGPLVRARLFSLGQEDHVLCFTMHHIVSDGWSMGVLVREVGALYAAFVRGQPSPLAPLELQYTDYAAWQRRWLTAGELDRQLAYWTKRLEGLPPLLELPTDRPRPKTSRRRAGTVTFVVPAPLVHGIDDRARRENATSFAALFAAFQLLLSRWSRQRDLVVGVSIANRSRHEVEGLIGLFVNTLALRTTIDPSHDFSALLAEVRRATLDAYEHQDVPFEKIVEAVAPTRSSSHAPLVQVLFGLQNAPEANLALTGMTTEAVLVGAADAKLDMDFFLRPRDGRLEGRVDYDAELFDDATMRRFADGYLALLEAVATNDPRPVLALPMMSASERRRIVGEWNRPATRYPDAMLHELVEAQARQTPRRAAITFENETVSYTELNARANRLARGLIERGVRTDDRVGLFVERSIEMVVAMLAVLKAGAAYLPLDVDAPSERVRGQIERASCRIVLGSAPASRIPTLELALAEENYATRSSDDLAQRAYPDSLAYVLYTSGSTGEPKAVCITHRSIVNHMLWMAEAYPLAEDDVVLQKTAYGFDASVWEFWAPLMAGTRLVMARPGAHRDGAYLVEVMHRERVTVLQVVPSMLRVLLEQPGFDRAPLRRVFCGGEALDRELQDRFFAQSPTASLVNLYGPTETTIDVTSFSCRRGDPRGLVSIGAAVSNASLYVLDDRLEPVPVGVGGELYIGGIPVARGYLGAPGVTASRFVPDPFSKHDGARMYASGDIVRWLTDGVLDYVGRSDHQVKIRGFRIELGEVESALSAQPGVREAVVSAQEDSTGSLRLIAYVVADVDREAIRGRLENQLPEHMVPGLIVMMETIPLGPNGKIDRKALPAAGDLVAQRMYVSPRSPTETTLVEIWRDLLGIERIGIHESFFELGGHSLLAAQVGSRVRSKLGVELSLKAIFDAPTIEGLGTTIDALRATPRTASLPPLLPREKGSPAPLTYMQERLWKVMSARPADTSFHMPVALRLRGALDLDALHRAFTEIIRRHEILRTTFDEVSPGTPAARVHPPYTPPLRVVKLASSGDPAATAHQILLEESLRVFDLRRGPLFRVTVLLVAPNDHILEFVVHHLVADGWSMRLLFDELAALYEAFIVGRGSPLPELTVQYADYAAWERSWLVGERLDHDRAFWRDFLRDVPARMPLPLDHPERADVPGSGAFSIGPVGRASLHVPPELIDELRGFAHETGSTVAHVLFAAYAQLLHHSAKIDDVVIGIPIAVRTPKESEALFGYFLNHLALRTDLSGNPTFRELLAQVTQVMMATHEHQHMPLSALPPIENIDDRLYQVRFNYMKLPRRRTLRIADLEGELISVDPGRTRFELALYAADEPEGFLVTLSYRRDLLDDVTARAMADAYLALLTRAVYVPDEPIDASIP